MSHDFVTDLFLSTPPPPVSPPPPASSCWGEESQFLLGLELTVEVRLPKLTQSQPNSERISPKAPGFGDPTSPHNDRPYRMLANKISLDPYSTTRQKPSSGAVPAVATLLRLREVARSLPSSIHPHQRCSGCETGWVRSPPSPVPCLWFRTCLIQLFCQGVWGGGKHANSMATRSDLSLFQKFQCTHGRVELRAVNQRTGSPGRSPAAVAPCCCHFGQ